VKDDLIGFPPGFSNGRGSQNGLVADPLARIAKMRETGDFKKSIPVLVLLIAK
jgi:hypothetical protein